MRSDLKEILEEQLAQQLDPESGISREAVLDAVADELKKICKDAFLDDSNIRIIKDRENFDIEIRATKYVLDEGEEVRDDEVEISLADARALYPEMDIRPDDDVYVEATSDELTKLIAERIPVAITRKIREEKKKLEDRVRVVYREEEEVTLASGRKAKRKPSEIKEALDSLVREKDIDKGVILNMIVDSLSKACKEYFTSVENVWIEADPNTCDIHVMAQKYVLGEGEEVRDPEVEISLEDARAIDEDAKPDDEIAVEVVSKEFSRIATQNAKNVITQKLREEERNIIYNYYASYLGKVLTGTVQRRIDHGSIINLGKTDAYLPDARRDRFREEGGRRDMGDVVPSEHLRPGQRIKVYLREIRTNEGGDKGGRGRDRRNKGTRYYVSRSHENLVRCLFEEEVTEIKDGTVEIMGIARDPGSRTKMAVVSHNPNVDPVGACVGVNGSRVNAIVNELFDEKIDIINWDENPGEMVKYALSPAKVVNVIVDTIRKEAKVIVPDNQLSLAIGRGGQNAKLAAQLTGYKIDIKKESEAAETDGFRVEEYLNAPEEEAFSMFDEEGNLIYDAEGHPLYDENGVPMYDDDGNVYNENNEIVGHIDLVGDDE